MNSTLNKITQDVTDSIVKNSEMRKLAKTWNPVGRKCFKIENKTKDYPYQWMQRKMQQISPSLAP